MGGTSTPATNLLGHIDRGDIPGSSHGPKILTPRLAGKTVLMTFHGGQPLDGVRTGYSEIANPFAGVSHAFNKERRPPGLIRTPLSFRHLA